MALNERGFADLAHRGDRLRDEGGDPVEVLDSFDERLQCVADLS